MHLCIWVLFLCLFAIFPFFFYPAEGNDFSLFMALDVHTLVLWGVCVVGSVVKILSVVCPSFVYLMLSSVAIKKYKKSMFYLHKLSQIIWVNWLKTFSVPCLAEMCEMTLEFYTLVPPLHLWSPPKRRPSIPPLCVLPPGAPLCVTGVQTGKRSADMPGQHTGPSGARNMRSSAYKATGRGALLSEIIRCLCLPAFWQIGSVFLWRRPSGFYYQALSGLSDTQTHIATASIDISVKWIELFTSLLNVRKYQWLSLSQSLLPPLLVTVS